MEAARIKIDMSTLSISMGPVTYDIRKQNNSQQYYIRNPVSLLIPANSIKAVELVTAAEEQEGVVKELIDNLPGLVIRPILTRPKDYQLQVNLINSSSNSVKIPANTIFATFVPASNIQADKDRPDDPSCLRSNDNLDTLRQVNK